MCERSLLIRVYGDSLGVPRASEGVPYTKTYAELIRAAIERMHPSSPVHLYNRSRGGGTVTSLLDEYLMDTGYFGPQSDDILIIQCGIVDCAPRPVPPAVRAMVGRLPGRMRIGTIAFLHRNRAKLLSIGPTWRETKPRSFIKTYRYWLERAATQCGRVYAINIAPTNEKTERQSPGLTSSIEMYNALIHQAVDEASSERVHLVDAYGELSRAARAGRDLITAEDGHHINVEGHAIYARLVLEAEQSRLLSQTGLNGNKALVPESTLAATRRE